MKLLRLLLLSVIITPVFAQVVIPGMLPTSSNYTLVSPPRWLLDGASGPIVARSKSTGGGPAPKAVTGNVAWKSLLDKSTALIAGNYTTPSVVLTSNFFPGDVVFVFATVCFGDNSQTASCSAAKTMLDAVETYMPIGYCIESIDKCAVGNGDFGITSYGTSEWITGWAGAFSLMRDQMTTTEKQNFTAKMLNDVSAWGGTNSSSSTTCTNTTTNTGLVTPITATTTGNLTGGSTAFTVASGTGIVIGQTVTGPGVANAAIVQSGSGTSWQFNIPATAALTGTTMKFYTTTGTTVTTTTAAFGAGHAFQIGDWVGSPDEQNSPAVITAIGSSTSATLMFAANLTGTLYRWPATFTVATDCGFMWSTKHDVSFPYTLTNTGGTVGGATMYPTTGGTESNLPAMFGSSNLQYADMWGSMQIINASLDDDVNASSRSIAEFAALYNFWYQSIYYWSGIQWTGFSTSGNAYNYDRAWFMVPGIAFMIQNQTASPASIPLMAGVRFKNLLTAAYLNTYPGEPSSLVQWAQLFSSDYAIGTSDIMGLVLGLRAFAGTPEAAYANYWMQNILPSSSTFGSVSPTLFWTETGINAGSASLSMPWIYLFTDPLDTATSTIPLQKAFNVTDTSSGSFPVGRFISRTSMTDLNASMVEIWADSLVNDQNPDHFWEGIGHPASYKIVKNNIMLSEDANGCTASNLFSASISPCWTGSGQESNYIQLGSDANLSDGMEPQLVLMPRALDSNSTAAYVRVDATQSYAFITPTRVWRDLVHLKGGGTDRIFVYDNVAGTPSETNTTFFNYPNNGVSPAGTTSLSGGIITSSYPGTGHSDATQLLTKVLSPAGANTLFLSSLGTMCSTCSGSTIRYALCASTTGTTCNTSATTMEDLVVHEPIVGTSNTLPTTGLITSDTGHACAEVDDATNPQIVCFGRAGIDYTSGSFTSGMPATGQVMITSVTPTATSGLTYKVMNGGSTVATGINVGADGTIVVSTGSGSITFGASSPSNNGALGGSAVIGGGASIH